MIQQKGERERRDIGHVLISVLIMKLSWEEVLWKGAFVWQILRTSGKHCLSFLETVLGSSSLKATLVTQTEQTPWPTTEIDGSAVHFSADTDFEVHSLLLYCAGLCSFKMTEKYPPCSALTLLVYEEVLEVLLTFSIEFLQWTY
ncbi:hypothetical protein TIFTF001_000387 [Ficus carica]|uniref:Uncharacterized protein n=1 Tax=Ficus carica TaxID=3494 RepID=A0AA87YX61_FICCA|nr:hypothetical protein TIFTF001_000387 [Ficus carica]